jgi:hypothetical protein
MINYEHKRIQAKYERRIKRFYKEINSGKYIYFMRFHGITKSQSIELFHLLKATFPKVNFTLIVIGNDAQSFERDWQIPHLRNFFGATKETPTGKESAKELKITR